MLKSFPFFMALLIMVVTVGCQNTQSAGNLKPAGPHRILSDRLHYESLDIHNHLFGSNKGKSDYLGAAAAAIKKMDKLGIGAIIVMPPPRSKSNPVRFDMDDLLPVIAKYPDRFMMMGGGGSLNLLLHETSPLKPLSASATNKFRQKAQDLLAKGAIGFGEIAIEHFSLSPTHPYESVPADHPLLLLLADIAAENNVPIDIHMEAVPEEMPLPARKVLTKSGQNPSVLHENMLAFERLLNHNPGANIIWSHLGWCNTGKRTPALSRELLARYPNLYMSFKLSRESVKETRPIGQDKNAIKPEWLQLIKDFPDRFLIGTDQFYVSPGGRQIGPQKTEATKMLVSLLPQQIRQAVTIDNPIKLFHLNAP